jgi:hypothetical protein
MRVFSDERSPFSSAHSAASIACDSPLRRGPELPVILAEAGGRLGMDPGDRPRPLWLGLSTALSEKGDRFGQLAAAECCWVADENCGSGPEAVEGMLAASLCGVRIVGASLQAQACVCVVVSNAKSSQFEEAP